MTFDFILPLVLCSSGEVSFYTICLNVLGDIKQFYLLMWFKKNRIESLFKCDNVNSLIKPSSCEKFVHYLFEKVQKIAAFAMPFLVFIDQTIAWKWFWLPQNDQKYPRYPLVLKLNVTLAWPLRLVILYFFKNGNPCQMIGTCIIMTANGDLMWMGSPIQNVCKIYCA